MNLLLQLHGERSKIDACTMQKRRGVHWYHPRGYMQMFMDQVESTLPTRLTDASFRGMVNFINATKADASMDQIQQALVSYRAKCIHY